MLLEMSTVAMSTPRVVIGYNRASMCRYIVFNFLIDELTIIICWVIDVFEFCIYL